MDESKCEGSGQVSQSDEAAKENHSSWQENGTRRPTTGTHTIIIRAAIAFSLSSFFYEAVVQQQVAYVTDF